MNTVLVWLLIATTSGTYESSSTSLIAKFATLDQCEHVRKNIPTKHSAVVAVCIQANVLKE